MIHQEIELKFEVPLKMKVAQVGAALFRDFDSNKASLPFQYSTPSKYKEVLRCPDFYLSNANGQVVRHRLGDNGGTLTCKALKGGDSIVNRHEVDLRLASSMSEVQQFLAMTGFTHDFTIMKSSYIWCFTPAGLPHVTVALYHVALWDSEKLKETSPRRAFLEVEVDRGTYTDTKSALRVLNIFRKYLMEVLSLGAPVNYSLYKLYSGGKDYLTIKEPAP